MIEKIRDVKLKEGERLKDTLMNFYKQDNSDEASFQKIGVSNESNFFSNSNIRIPEIINEEYDSNKRVPFRKNLNISSQVNLKENPNNSNIINIGSLKENLAFLRKTKKEILNHITPDLDDNV